MALYLIRRALLLVPMAFVISAVVFWAMRMIPVDPASLILGPWATPEQKELARVKLGLDQPVYVQYSIFMGNALHGELGQSIRSGKDVTELIRETLPNTLLLGMIAVVVIHVVAIPLGVISAIKHNTVVDQIAMIVALVGIGIPAFWLGLLLILLFSVHLGWFPAVGSGSWRHLVLPAVTLSLEGMALTARMTRSSMLEVLGQDYVRVARAKGLHERRVLYGHALRNAAIPIISLLGLRLGWLVGGAVVVEQIFTWPGMGRLLVESILARDYPVAQAILILLGVSVILANLLADALYALLDPHVRHAD
jgi:ABC-type dipeptide/oligopeptide/nickel transport system permease component